jgi:hypothetical protein
MSTKPTPKKTYAIQAGNIHYHTVPSLLSPHFPEDTPVRNRVPEAAYEKLSEATANSNLIANFNSEPLIFAAPLIGFPGCM